MKKYITAKGIKVHNLKNIDVRVPLGKFTAITGVSGSGKSSLAFDTLYAEGQRRYIESFSAYARQFLERMDKPDVDHIEGIPAAIAIEQKNPVKNRRSTVGTATEINDYLRLFFAKIGKTHCGECGKPVKKDLVSEIVKKIGDLETGSKALLAFPVIIRPGVDHAGHIAALLEKGIVRALIDRKVIDISREDAGSFDITKAKSAFGIIDRITVKDGINDRLADGIESGYGLGEGRMGVAFESGKAKDVGSKPADWDVKWLFSKHFMCNGCDIEYPDVEPQMLSFNNPVGACPVCQGFGHTIEIDMNLVIPDRNKSLKEGAIVPWNTPKYSNIKRELLRGAPKYKIPVDEPFKKLKKEHLALIMKGTPEFLGIDQFFKKLGRKKYKMHVRVLLSKYRGYETCEPCSGSRLNDHARHIKINTLNITDVCAMNIDNAIKFFSGIKLDRFEKEVSGLILEEIQKRLDYMSQIGLGYLTLDRMTRTLSGGEAQRVNITTSLGSSLVNTLYILDEPSIGLHSRDTDRLIGTLKKLKDIGNTVVVVEHDNAIINAADEIIDIGPRAGENGGKVVYQGAVKDMPDDNGSITGQYLKGSKKVEVPSERKKTTKKAITLKGASQNNLKGIDVVFPLEVFICVTGVSGSGKSTMIQDTLYGALKSKINAYSGHIGKHKSITGHQHVNDVILVDQSPIGRTPRSNPITYVKVFDEIRKMFAGSREAKAAGIGPGYFSFNVAGGRCDNCEGCGQEKIEMQFLADIFVTCEYCEGKRFRSEILDIKYNDKNICEVLDMTVDEAAGFFKDSSRVLKGLKHLQDTGLGYLRLGQPATTLSGGEAQRLKLATFIAKGSTGRILFIFDEPTTGLHFYDIHKLLNCFGKLIEAGHSVIVVEHNLDVIKSADYIIDLGPEGGEGGGSLIGCGTPEEMAKINSSYTGQHLRNCLN